MRFADPGHFALTAHGLPMLCSSPSRTAEDFELPIQQADKPISQSTVQPASQSKSVSTQTANGSWHEAQAPKELRRLDELHEAYPYKLIRELDRISSEPSLLGQETRVFGVIHVNSSAYKGLTVEHVGTYTSAKAANDRVLDFWDQNYGMKMFTVKFEWFKDPESHLSQISCVRKPNDGSSGGVEANNSHWKIADQCLTLSHRSHEEEKKVYAVVSYLRDRGVHC